MPVGSTSACRWTPMRRGARRTLRRAVSLNVDT